MTTSKIVMVFLVLLVLAAVVGATAYWLEEGGANQHALVIDTTEKPKEAAVTAGDQTDPIANDAAGSATHILPAKTSLEDIHNAEKGAIDGQSVGQNGEDPTLADPTSLTYEEEPTSEELADIQRRLKDLGIEMDGIFNEQMLGEPFTVTLLGRVVDEGGEPVAGVSVAGASGAREMFSSITLGGSDEADEEFVQSLDTKGKAQTASDGTFSVELTGRMPANGSVQLNVAIEKQGYAKAKSEGIRYTKSADLPRVQLTLYRGATISGRVLDKATKEPFAGASVKLEQTASVLPKVAAPSGFKVLRMTSAGASAVAAADGSFSFPSLVDGTFEVEARTKAAPESSVGVNARVIVEGTFFSTESEGDGAKVTATVSGGKDPAALTIYLVRDASLVFRLAHPAENVMYLLKEATNSNSFFFGTDILGGSGFTAVSAEASGEYRISGVKSKQRTLVLKASGYTDTEFAFVPVAGEEVNMGTLELKRGIRISGRVTDTSGAPVAGVSMRIESSAGGFGAVSFVTSDSFFGATQFPGSEATRTDADGKYVVDSQKEGSLKLYAAKKGYAIEQVRLTLSLDDPERVQDFVMSKGGSIEGTSTLPPASNASDNDARPTESFEVRVFGGSGENFVGLIGEGTDGPSGLMFGSTSSDAELSRASRSIFKATLKADGSFIIENVRPGTYTVVGSYRGLKGKAENIRVVEGEATRAHLVFSQGGTVFGRVYDRNGMPLAGKRVSAQSYSTWYAGGNDDSGAVTDGAGNYELQGVPTGQMVILLEGESGRGYNQAFRDKRSVTVVEGERVERNIDLSESAGVRVFGKVTLNQEGVFNQVYLNSSGGGLSGEVKKDGSYEILDVPAGTYELLAYGWGNKGSNTSSKTTIVVPDNVSEFEFHKNWQGFRVSGTVTAPVPTVDFSLAQLSLKQLSEDGAPSHNGNWGISTDVPVQVSGAFQSAAIAEGHYEVVVAHPDFAPVKQNIHLTSNLTLNLELNAQAGSIEVIVKSMPEREVPNSFDFIILRLTGPNGEDVTLAGAAGYLRVQGVGSSQTLNSIAAGTYTLSVSGSIYEPATYSVSVLANAKAVVELNLTTAARLTLTLSGEGVTAQALTNATLTVTNLTSGQPVHPDRVQRSGTRIIASGLAAGSYRVQLTAAGFQNLDRTFTVTSGQHLEETLPLVAAND